MNNIQFARQQIALNFLLVGFGIGIFFVPYFSLFWNMDHSLRISLLICFPVSFYVVGIGIAGIIEGGIRMARAIKS